MDPTPSPPPHSPGDFPDALSRKLFADAFHFWEIRRLFYNLSLAVVVILWLVASWPHFRPAFTLIHLFQLAALALMANLCYCAAYLVDIPMQLSAFHAFWKRRRWVLWLGGTLFAILLTNYWIADEIYPFIHQ
jgi:hypothetical protein